MKLDDIMQKHDGKWENDIATVKPGAYFVQVARKIDGKIELTEEGLRSFPELGGRVVKASVVEPVAEEPIMEPAVEELVVNEGLESNLDEDLAAALADEPVEAPKKKKHGK